MKPRHLSLFSGSGIGDYIAELAGFETVALCECEPDCLYALRKIYPMARIFDDVRTVGLSSDLGRIDLISGGFPCQDISAAGKGAGLEGARSGLWFEMLRIIREVGPAWVLAENVPALRTRGADRVIADMEESGYTVWPSVVGAWTAGAPHKRDRVWIVAHFHGEPSQQANPQAQPFETERNTRVGFAGCDRTRGDQEDELADADKTGQREQRGAVSISSELATAECIRFDHWPARPGEEQHDWEEPRVVADASCRRMADSKHNRDRRWEQQQESGKGEWETGLNIRQTEPRLGLATDGLARPLLPAVRRSLLRVLGNGWAPQVPWLILCWIREQIEKENHD